MSDVKNVAVERALLLLNASKCKYAIITQDGKEIVNGVELAKPTGNRTRSPSMYKYGELSGYCRKAMPLDAEISSVHLVPFNGYEKLVLRRALCAWLTNHWGKDSYISNVREDGIEILRIS